LLFYEAAEGGAGVLRRLLDDRGDASQPGALDRVINQALDLCHFDPVDARDRGGAAPERDPCEAACYDCLLSYFNQLDHGHVDRKLIPELLLPWRGASLDSSREPTPREDRLDTLLSVCKSDLERRWLNFLATNGYNLPTEAQVVVASGNVCADFLYEPDRGLPVLVFIGGPSHAQEQLENVGYLVLHFDHQVRWEDVVARYPSVFGTGSTRGTTIAVLKQVDEGELAALLELFEPKWHATIRRLAAHPSLTIEAGGELGTRVSATYLASIVRGERTLYIIDAAEPDAELAQDLLQGRGDRVLRLRADDPDPLTAVLRATGGSK
jgi:hypothetical protein